MPGRRLWLAVGAEVRRCFDSSRDAFRASRRIGYSVRRMASILLTLIRTRDILF